MRLPLQVASKKTVKMIRVKQIASKEKGLKRIKSFGDSISETISFVIKGKLTPVKTTSLGRSSVVCKKSPALLSKKQIVKGGEKKIKNNDKSRKSMKKEKNEDTQLQGQKNCSVVRKTIIKKKKESDSNSLAFQEYNANEVKQSNMSPKTKIECLDKSDKKVSRGSILEGQKVKFESNMLNKKLTNDLIKHSKSALKTETKHSDKVKQQVIPNKRKKLQEATTKKINKILKRIDKTEAGLQLINNCVRQKKSLSKLKGKPKKSVVYTNQPTEVKDTKKKKLPPKSKLAKDNVKPTKQTLMKSKLQKAVKPVKRKKSQNEDTYISGTDDTCTSDELTLDLLFQNKETNSKPELNTTVKASKSIKNEYSLNTEKKCKKQGGSRQQKKPNKMLTQKPKVVVLKKRLLKNKNKRKEDTKTRKLKLLGLWNSPKRHRVASLNALAKVHCLYENETRSTILDAMESIKSDGNPERKRLSIKENETSIMPTRILRSVPGLRAVGKHWDLDDTTSSSSEDNDSSISISNTNQLKQKAGSGSNKIQEVTTIKKEKKRRRNRTEIIMDLKDMVVRKRMASLNASAILAASYSMEKRTLKSPKSEDTDSYETDESFKRNKENKQYGEDVKKEDDKNVIEVCATPNKKVAVILNQDTDVTITGVYVNSTTRSTHHEGYCSIAGMQYRISATSHTQTAATAVSTETLLQSSCSSTQESVS